MSSWKRCRLRRRCASHDACGIDGGRIRPRASLDQISYAFGEYVRVDRLREKIVSTQVHGANGGVDGAESTDHENRNAVAPESQRFDERESVNPRHSQIEEKQIETVGTPRVHRVVAIVRRLDVARHRRRQP